MRRSCPGKLTPRCSRRSMMRSCTLTRPPRTPWQECRNMLSVASLRCPPCGVGRPGRGPIVGVLARWTRRSITPPRHGRQEVPYHDYDGNHGYDEFGPAQSAGRRRRVRTPESSRKAARALSQLPGGERGRWMAPSAELEGCASRIGPARSQPITHSARSIRAKCAIGLSAQELGRCQSHSMSSSKRPGQCRRYSSTRPAK
jgi:hypothetical protein